MTRRQKHKAMKRPRSWHRRGRGPDIALQKALRRIDRAMQTNQPTEENSHD